MPIEKENLWGRITKAFGTSDVAAIQEKLKDLVKTVQAVYKWDKGGVPSLETFVLIGDLTGSSIHWLVTGQGPMKLNELGGYKFPDRIEKAIQSQAKEWENTYEGEIEDLVTEALMARRILPVDLKVEAMFYDDGANLDSLEDQIEMRRVVRFSSRKIKAKKEKEQKR